VPEFILCLAYVLAAVAATGFVLDRAKARRSVRAAAWAAVLLLLLPASLITFIVYMNAHHGRSWLL
jgi:hypothetical protein